MGSLKQMSSNEPNLFYLNYFTMDWAGAGGRAFS